MNSSLPAGLERLNPLLVRAVVWLLGVWILSSSLVTATNHTIGIHHTHATKNLTELENKKIRIPSPHSKWPRARNRMEFFRRWVYHLRVSLALIPFADIPSGICLHIWPKVPQRFDLPYQMRHYLLIAVCMATDSGHATQKDRKTVRSKKTLL